MDKLKFETPDMVAGNIEKIGALFPAAITEIRGEDGQIKKGINFEVLKQLLSRDVVDGDECYEFTWVGKKAAMAETARPITKTLRPVKEDSRDWDTTQNLYIEGDNLEVLKILQESYLGKVKMIYIDPPYNKGKDFIYPDKFIVDSQEYDERSNYVDEVGNINFARQNTSSSGRYHSDWCSMISSRLTLARNLLTDDGVIFISIDDSENTNLRNLCNNIFGESNFIAQFTRKGSGGRQDSAYYAIVHEYLLCYSKDASSFVSGKIIKTDESYPFYDDQKRCRYKTQLLRKWGENSRKDDRPNLFYPILDPDGKEHYPMLTDTEEGCWRWGKETMQTNIEKGLVEFKRKDGKWIAYEKVLEPQEGEEKTKLYSTIIDDISNSSGAALLKDLFSGKIFDYPKPVEYIIRCISLANCKNEEIILDFFSGSATTAHAVMQLNAEDGGHRKFIMVQLPEPCAEGTEAANAGFKNICEIGKERIRRAGDKIKADNPLGTQDLDIGFRVFRVDESNMKDVYYHPEELNQQSMFDLVSNIKDDRTDLDLLYACLLDWGVEIHLPHTSTDLDGCTVHNVDNGALMACFSPNVPRSVVEYMAKQQPLRAVFRDSAFASDDAKINVTEIFKNLSPDTKVKVI